MAGRAVTARLTRETRHHFHRPGILALRYIVRGPAGAVALGIRLGNKGSDDHLGQELQAETHYHAYAPGPHGFDRDDCDVLTGGRCTFESSWGRTASDLWAEAIANDDEERVWAYLEDTYIDHFNVERP
jgi:hypothetical protein